jgi:hypothetical protein
VSPEKSEKSEISIGIPGLIEIHFKREKVVKAVDVKPGEMKVLVLNDRVLILHYDENTKKLRYAFFDNNGRLKDVGKLFKGR